MKSVAQPSNFVIDPIRDGVLNALWKAITGTLAISSNKFRFNTADGIVRADMLYGQFEFSVNFPTTGVQTPTDLTNDILFGLKNAALGTLGKIDFFVDQSGNKAYFRTYDDFGTAETTEVTWDTDWNSAQTIFGIDWEDEQVRLYVIANGDDQRVTLATHNTSVPRRPLNLYATAVGADNFDVDWISLVDVLTTSIMLI